MLVKMPYGPVEITNKKEARSFVIHMCDNCGSNNLMNPCSGAMALQCQKEKEKVILKFSSNIIK